MKRFLYKTALYGVLILIFLEGIVRVFHLYKDTPVRFIDELGVEKWVPGQSGFSVTGNRRQNFSEYRINQSGYNSYREFDPFDDDYVVALVGDSYIEGFHQPYYNSIGKKIEELRPGIAVYEYGYAGYDLADQLHLISAYRAQFEEMDKVVIYLKYPDDLLRDQHSVSRDRIRLNSGIYKYLKMSKLLVYSQNIGLIGALRAKLVRLKSFKFSKISIEKSEPLEEEFGEQYERYFQNFTRLCDDFEFDKSKFLFLLDSREVPSEFLGYLNDHQYVYIDYAQEFKQSEKPVTLIYDQHWNDHGRQLIAQQIVADLKSDIRESEEKR
jgi:hypothetical protein